MKTIVELLIERRNLDSDRVFCKFEREAVTYAWLARRVETVAGALDRLGIRPGDRVGLMLENNLDHILLFCSLAWIGAVHIPISTHLKRDGLALLLADAVPTLVIAEARCAAELNSAVQACVRRPMQLWRGGGVEGHGSDRGLSSILSTPDWSMAPFPGDLNRWAMISYTSGTTGPPKGVMLNERFLQLGAKNAALLADVKREDVLLLWEPFHHIAGWITVLIGLHYAVLLALVPRFSASRCWDQVREYGVTKLHYLGGMINILLRQPARGNDASNPATIAWGAAAPAASWREFEKRFGLRIREGYGITEAANFALINLDGPVGSVGKPVPEFEAWIAAADATRLGPKKVGEIVLRPKSSHISMMGYFRNSEATARVLRDGDVYTGDLGYQDEDGFFYFAGRLKDSLRRRGENVSAWEVERIINSHPKVVDSAVIGVPSDLGEEDIKAFVKLADGAELTAEQIVTWCEPRLAHYQMPRYVDFVSEFPRGPTQRIQKSDLPRSTAGVFDAQKAAHRPKQEI
jgi:crotonobetaine/carnitine-CoA ligase